MSIDNLVKIQKAAKITKAQADKKVKVEKEVSDPLANVNNITIYRYQSIKLIENNTQKIDKILKIAEDNLELNIKKFIKNIAANKILKNNKEDKDKKIK